jgi:hypothetical protein
VSGLTRARRLAADPVMRRRGLVAVGCLLATLFPLVGTLGYENAFVLSPVFALLGVTIGVDATRRRAARRPEGERQASPAGELVAIVGDAARELAILCGLALGILLLGQLWQENCDPLGGLGFFFMGPVLSGGIGIACGLWGGALAARRGRQIALGVLPMIVSTAIGAWRLIADPVVFAYDPYWGYFSGSIYDEAVGIGRTYLVFRAYTALLGLAALATWTLLVDPTTLRVRRPNRPGAAHLVLSAGLVVSAGVVGLRGPGLGFTANTDTITRVLSGERETEHFVIHYAPRSANAREIDAIAAEHEFAWARLRRLTGREPEGKVHSFVFTSPEQKRALMGAGRVQVAAPWRGQIYLDYKPFPHPVLHHELAHVFGRTVGDSLFGVSRSGLFINIALIEGFATALAPRPADDLDLHDQALVLERLGMRPPLPAIMGPAFFTRSSSVAYTAAGSFCAWLIETRGFEAMGVLYGSGDDFELAYGTSLEALEAEWLAFLNARGGVTDEDVAAQRQRFERRSVFQRPCAHRAATLLEEVRHANAKGRWTEAVDGFRTLCEIEPELPEHQLGLAQALAIAGDAEGAREALHGAMKAEDLNVSLRAAILESAADIATVPGAEHLGDAREAIDAALALPLSEDRRRGLELRRLATEDPELSPLVHAYFGPFMADADPVTAAVRRLWTAAKIQELRPALGSYLVARQLLNAEQPAAALPVLREALSSDLDHKTGDPMPSPLFLRAAREALMSAALQTGDYDLAREALAALSADPTNRNGQRLEYAYWAERIDFFEAYLSSAP